MNVPNVPNDVPNVPNVPNDVPNVPNGARGRSLCGVPKCKFRTRIYEPK